MHEFPWKVIWFVVKAGNKPPNIHNSAIFICHLKSTAERRDLVASDSPTRHVQSPCTAAALEVGNTAVISHDGKRTEVKNKNFRDTHLDTSVG